VARQQRCRARRCDACVAGAGEGEADEWDRCCTVSPPIYSNNLFELNWFKKGLTLLKNFQTKYERVGIERMNNFQYWNLEAFDLDGICHVGGKSNLEHTSCCELLPNLHIF
jgi:hypothetical protein